MHDNIILSVKAECTRIWSSLQSGSEVTLCLLAFPFPSELALAFFNVAVVHVCLLVPTRHVCLLISDISICVTRVNQPFMTTARLHMRSSNFEIKNCKAF